MEDESGNRWEDFDVWDRSEVALLRLLERLPDAERYSSDAYGAYGCLPMNKRKGRQGRGGEQERGIAFSIARQIERACATRKGLFQGGWNADDVDCVGMAEIRLDLTRLHVLGIPGGGITNWVWRNERSDRRLLTRKGVGIR